MFCDVTGVGPWYGDNLEMSVTACAMSGLLAKLIKGTSRQNASQYSSTVSAAFAALEIEGGTTDVESGESGPSMLKVSPSKGPTNLATSGEAPAGTASHCALIPAVHAQRRLSLLRLWALTAD